MEKTSWLHTKCTLNNPSLPYWPLARVVELRLFWLPSDFRWHKSLAKGNCLKINSILLWRSNGTHTHTHIHTPTLIHIYIYIYIACLVDCVCVCDAFQTQPETNRQNLLLLRFILFSKICGRLSHLLPLRLCTMGVWYSSPLSDAARLECAVAHCRAWLFVSVAPGMLSLLCSVGLRCWPGLLFWPKAVKLHETKQHQVCKRVCVCECACLKGGCKCAFSSSKRLDQLQSIQQTFNNNNSNNNKCGNNKNELKHYAINIREGVKMCKMFGVNSSEMTCETLWNYIKQTCSSRNSIRLMDLHWKRAEKRFGQTWMTFKGSAVELANWNLLTLN